MLGACARVAVTGRAHPAEQQVFRAVNRQHRVWFPGAYAVHLSGIAGAAPVVAGVAWWRGARRLAVAAGLAFAGKQVGEKAVKRVVDRQRPAAVLDEEVVTRGQVHRTGKSFPSGHATLAAALAGVTAPYLPGAWRVLPLGLAAGTGLARVYVGAHHPLDVVAGAGLGLAVAGSVNLVLGVPVRGS